MNAEVKIVNSIYKIACKPDDHKKIIDTAEKLNQRILKLKNLLGEIDEKTAIVITALMMEDEIKKLHLKNNNQPNYPINQDQQIIEAITTNNLKICEQLEKIIDIVKNS